MWRGYRILFDAPCSCSMARRQGRAYSASSLINAARLYKVIRVTIAHEGLWYHPKLDIKLPCAPSQLLFGRMRRLFVGGDRSTSTSPPPFFMFLLHLCEFPISISLVTAPSHIARSRSTVSQRPPFGNPMDHQLQRLPSWLVGPQTPAEWDLYMAVHCSRVGGGASGGRSGGSVSAFVVGEEKSKRKKRKSGHWRNLQHVYVIASQRTTR